MTRTLSILRTHDDRAIPTAGKYVIDPAHTSVEFIGRHLMITKVKGRMADVSGQITVEDDPERSHVEVRLAAGTLSTGNPERDAHLRSADFLDVEAFPTMTFLSTDVRAGEDGSWTVVGDLTVRDIARRVTLRVDFDGAGQSPDGDERISFSASTEVDRQDWGLVWNQPLESGGVLVGRKVRIEIDVQAVAPPAA